MISDKVIIADKENECEGIDTALEVIGKTALFCGFDAAAAGRLKLLAQEMVTGSAAILDYFKGQLWAETDERAFMIKLEMEGTFTQDERERFVALTRDNKNTLPKGFFAKLGVLLSDALTGEYVYPYGPGTDPTNAEMLWSATEIAEMMAELDRRDPEDEQSAKEAKEVLDHLADDITVSARGDHVLITVTKALPVKEK